jgi:hypothetical protein
MFTIAALTSSCLTFAIQGLYYIFRDDGIPGKDAGEYEGILGIFIEPGFFNELAFIPDGMYLPAFFIIELGFISAYCLD